MTSLPHILYLAWIIIVFTGTENAKADIDAHDAWGQLPTNSCGIAKSPNRIVGGIKAYPGQFPWLVRLGYQYTTSVNVFICGGSLITTRLVITAAHCFTPWHKKYFVRLPAQDVDEKENCDGDICEHSERDISVSDVMVHEHYDEEKVVNDIAIFKMRTEVKFNELVQPICLPRNELLDIKHKGNAVVAGWGVISSRTNQVPGALMYVHLPFAESSECAGHITDLNDISRICVGKGSGKDSCQGDSGGPLMISYRLPDDKVRRSYLVGLVSFGPAKCGSGPGVYTNVSYFADWILEVIDYLK